MKNDVIEVVHMGPASPGGMLTMIHLLLKKANQRGKSRFFPTYRHFKRHYVANAVCFAHALLATLFSPDRNAVYQLHTAEKGSFWRKYLISLVLRWHEIPYIVHMHGARFAVFLDASRPVTRRLVGSYFAKAKRLVVLSESWAGYFHTIYPDLKNIEVLPNPCETVGEQVPHRVKTTKVKILYSGVFGKRKGVFDLIQAFSRLPKGEHELHLFGDGDLNAVQQAVKDSGSGERIFASGWLPHDQYLNNLSNYDVYVLPSYAEGLPMSILEAMGQALPIISTRVGGIPEAVEDQKNGILIESGDCEALSNALWSLIEGNEVRERMGLRSWEIAKERYSMDILMRRWDLLYECSF